MKFIISDKWLKACGRLYLSGKALEVKSVRDFGKQGKFYKVVIPSLNTDWETTWEVWDVRGITIIE